MSQTCTGSNAEGTADLRHQLGGTVGGGLDVRLGRVEFLVLAGFAGEEDEAGFVGLESFNVCGEGFLRVVCSAGVDGDADCGCEFAGDAGFLLQVC